MPCGLWIFPCACAVRARSRAAAAAAAARMTSLFSYRSASLALAASYTNCTFCLYNCTVFAQAVGKGRHKTFLSEIEYVVSRRQCSLPVRRFLYNL